MKRTYIQPTFTIVQIEISSIVCASGYPEQVYVPTGGETATEYDAPRVRLWGE
ncbi:MAG: hypothetical protein K6E86_03320 [Bacteroidales bacterium]|nr:hypothetical protein [Bacteroidales bacterium]